MKRQSQTPGKLFVLLALGLLLAVAMPAKAQTTTIASANGGGVENALRTELAGSALSTVTDLTVTGTIDARDFRFIRDSLGIPGSLQALDLSGCVITAYSGTAGPGVQTGTQTPYYGADTVPQYALFARVNAGDPWWPDWKDVSCPSLAKIILPAGTKCIEIYALGGMPAQELDLSSLTALERIDNYVFYKSQYSKVIFPSTAGFVYMGIKPFSMCAAIDTIKIPASITTLGNSAYFVEGCTSLKSLEFEETCQLTTLPGMMFTGPTPATSPQSLTYVKLPSSVTNIGTCFDGFIGTYIDCHQDNPNYKSIDGVLYNKADNTIAAIPKGLTSFTIPADMTVIPNNLFANMPNLTSVTVLSSLTEIGERAFYNTGITSFNFPSTLTKIGNYAFSMSKLTSVTLSNNSNLINIGNNVFSSISTLTSVDVSGLGKTGQAMFSGNSNLTDVNLGSTITKIADNTFANCKLTTISIPNSVDSIGKSAFDGCGSLTTINIPTGLKYLGALAFRQTAVEGTMTLPASLTSIGLDSYGGTAFNQTRIRINVDMANPNYSSIDGMLLNKEETVLMYIPNAATSQEVVLPEGIKRIIAYALYSNADSNITQITLPSTLDTIENNGLYGASKMESIISNAVVPPVCLGGNWSYALGDQNTYNIKKITIPAQTKAAYKLANCWKAYPDSLYVMRGKFTDLGYGGANAVSPNGRYVAATLGNDGVIYNTATSTVNTIKGSTDARDVNDNMQVALMFKDTNYKRNGEAIETGGVYRDGKIYGLGLGRFGAIPADAMPPVNPLSIDSFGNVYGSTFLKNNATKLVPFAWKWNEVDYTTDTMPLAYPQLTGNDQGGTVQSVSKDGQTAGGWFALDKYGGSRMAVLWTSPNDYQLLDESNSALSGGMVSPDGNYFIQEYKGRAAIYDKQKEELIVFGPQNSIPTAVSNTGFVVGYEQDYIVGARRGFIWSDKLGYMTLRQFIDKHLPTMQIPEGEWFNFPDNFSRQDLPVDISEDGLTIVGWAGPGGLVKKAWIMQLPEALDLIDRPHNLTATVDIPKRNTVNIEWTAPTEYGTASLDWYYIYRNEEFIARIETYEGTTYTDTNAPAGLVSYQVTAIYNYVDANTYLESPKTDPAEVTIINNYDLPFMDDFENGTFAHKHWTAERQGTAAWNLWDLTGKINGKRAVIFMTNGDRTPYNLSLTSKPLDATSAEKVILAFNHQINAYTNEFLGVKDTISIEVGFDDNWTTVKQIIASSIFPYECVTVDISQAAAKKLFRVRFRASSGANRNLYNYVLDNVGVSLEESATAPSDIIAYRNRNNEPVKVMYKDVAGSYGFTYGTGINGYMNAGNEGNPIIAANHFGQNDLIKMKDKYLTSVSAFLFSDYPGTEIPSVLKLAVFVNDERVENSTIENWQGYAWNNFPLTTPIKITGNDDIFVGIEAAYGDLYNRPLSMGLEPYDTVTKTYAINSNGNFYSEDNGATWLNANPDIGFFGHWDIIANIRDENVAANPDADIYAVRYEIYRGDEKLEALHYGQVYTDTAGSDDDCYTVKAFRILGGMSPMSSKGCVEVLAIERFSETGKVQVYPNPVCDIVKIAADCKVVRVYDMKGKLVALRNASQVDMSGLTSGTYLLEVITRDGRILTAKVIKK